MNTQLRMLHDGNAITLEDSIKRMFWSDLSYKDIARELGTSYSKVDRVMRDTFSDVQRHERRCRINKKYHHGERHDNRSDNIYCR